MEVLQIYVLSIVTNLVGGLILMTARIKDEHVKSLARRPIVRITVGVLAILTGLAKFAVQHPADQALIVGDLLPALAGILVGAVILGDIYVQRREELDEASGFFRRYNPLLRIPSGIVGIAAAVLHFIVPGQVIL
jgi:hypothetical protein